MFSFIWFAKPWLIDFIRRLIFATGWSGTLFLPWLGCNWPLGSWRKQTIWVSPVYWPLALGSWLNPLVGVKLKYPLVLLSLYLGMKSLGVYGFFDRSFVRSLYLLLINKKVLLS